MESSSVAGRRDSGRFHDANRSHLFLREYNSTSQSVPGDGREEVDSDLVSL